MPLRPPLPQAIHPPPYRLFHLSARLRLRDRPSPTPSQAEDDYYSLLLSTPTASPSAVNVIKTTNPARAPRPTQPSSSSAPTTAPKTRSIPIETSSAGPNNQVLFSRVLDGPSTRMRGLARAENPSLGRPPEPDNCCMSGCVNCVWDGYREEVEEWAAARRRGGGQEGREVGGSGRGGGVGHGDASGVGDLDGMGVGGYEGVEVGDEEMFRGLPVGILEFMNTEKRLRERRAAEKKG